jgi:hypothetical protein
MAEVIFVQYQRHASITRPVVPPGQISQNTFNFLNDLKDPECNDREWWVGQHTLRASFLRFCPTGLNYTVRNNY